MATLRDLLTASLRKIGVIPHNAVPPAWMLEQAKNALNYKLDEWNADSFTMYNTKMEDFSFLQGQSCYTLGPGGEFDTPDVDLRRMSVLVNSNVGNGGGGGGGGNFIRYGEIVVVNGYGVNYDVGILNFLTESNPFSDPFSTSLGQSQHIPSTITSYNRLCYGTLDYLDISIGAGELSNSAGQVGPFAKGNSRSYSVEFHDYYRWHYWVPMKNGDQIWVVATTFNGVGGEFSVELVVGPTYSRGEKFLCTGNSIYDYDTTIYIERLAWAGDR